MFIPLSGNYKIRDLLSSPLVLALMIINFSGFFIICYDYLRPGRSVTILSPELKISIQTRAGTVRETLSDAGIELTENTLVFPDLSARISDYSVIHLITRTTSISTQELPVPPGSPVVKKTDLLASGESITVRTASAGKIFEFYHETYFNNQLICRKKISEQVVKEPLSAVVLIGTGYKNQLKNLGMVCGASTGKIDLPEGSLLYAPGLGYIRDTDSLPVGISLSCEPSSDKKPVYHVY